MIVKVFSKENCIQCKMSKKLLDEIGVLYTEINISENDEALKYLKDQGVLSAPFIEVWNVKKSPISWSGFNPAKINKLKKY